MFTPLQPIKSNYSSLRDGEKNYDPVAFPSRSHTIYSKTSFDVGYRFKRIIMLQNVY